MTSRKRSFWKIVALAVVPLAVFAADAWLYVSMRGWTYNVQDNGRDTFWPAVLAFGGIFFPLAAVVLGSAIFDIVSAVASTRWRVTEGRVTACTVKEEERSRRGWIGWETYYKYLPAITYAYDAAGRSYTSDVTAFGLEAFDTREEAEMMLRGYPQGAPVRVHYDPDDPQVSVLQSTAGWGWKALLGAALAAFMPFLIAFMLVRSPP